MARDLKYRLSKLAGAGVNIIDPRQTYVAEDVDLDRVCPEAVLHPGTRLCGSRTFVGPRARVATEGPAVLDNAVLGADAEVASGYLQECVLLARARVGANAHIRAGTLLEEAVSVAHAVGLKHTILMSFVKLGSLINFCDALVSGGTSERDHTEIGSGSIHFNFTPWGAQGDKATPSIIGGVPHGAFLRQPRIFFGGLSGLAGPHKVGFGSLTVAGQIVRRDIPARKIVSDTPRAIEREWQFGNVELPGPRLNANLEYIGHLVALKAWYQQVRLARIPSGNKFNPLHIVHHEAIATLDACIEERIHQLMKFLNERGVRKDAVRFDVPPSPIKISTALPYVEHIEWVRHLPNQVVEDGAAWLQAIVDSVSLSEQ
jgi:UDP-N-acetylglucosamine/UDP-N-acetylgalactosamine diphosphorylase